MTLRDAGDYLTSLPKAEQNLEESQTAIGCQIGAAEGRNLMMHARIGMLRALNRSVERTFNPDRKDTHWVTVCTIWIIVSGLVHSFRENR